MNIHALNRDSRMIRKQACLVVAALTWLSQPLAAHTMVEQAVHIHDSDLFGSGLLALIVLLAVLAWQRKS